MDLWGKRVESDPRSSGSRPGPPRLPDPSRRVIVTARFIACAHKRGAHAPDAPAVTVRLALDPSAENRAPDGKAAVARPEYANHGEADTARQVFNDTDAHAVGW
jgi:hypothetical protein